MGQDICISAGLSRHWLGDLRIYPTLSLGALRFGLIVCVVRLETCWRVDDPRLPRWMRESRYCFGPWCWGLTSVRLIRETIPCRGMLGLWTLPTEIELSVRAMVGVQSNATTLPGLAE
jgi:hypothetical protein